MGKSRRKWVKFHAILEIKDNGYVDYFEINSYINDGENIISVINDILGKDGGIPRYKIVSITK